MDILRNSKIFMPISGRLTTRPVYRILSRDSARILFCAGECRTFIGRGHDDFPGVAAFVTVSRRRSNSSTLSCGGLVRGKGTLCRDNRENVRRVRGSVGSVQVLICASNAAKITGNIVLDRCGLVDDVCCNLRISRLCSINLSILPCGRACRTVPKVLITVRIRTALYVGRDLGTILGGVAICHPRCVCPMPTFIRIFCEGV